MKKIFIFVAAVMMTAFVGCGQKTASNEIADSTAIDSIETADSIIDSLEVVDSAAVDSTVCPD